MRRVMSLKLVCSQSVFSWCKMIKVDRRWGIQTLSAKLTTCQASLRVMNQRGPSFVVSFDLWCAISWLNILVVCWTFLLWYFLISTTTVVILFAQNSRRNFSRSPQDSRGNESRWTPEASCHITSSLWCLTVIRCRQKIIKSYSHVCKTRHLEQHIKEHLIASRRFRSFSWKSWQKFKCVLSFCSYVSRLRQFPTSREITSTLPSCLWLKMSRQATQRTPMLPSTSVHRLSFLGKYHCQRQLTKKLVMLPTNSSSDINGIRVLKE